MDEEGPELGKPKRWHVVEVDLLWVVLFVLFVAVVVLVLRGAILLWGTWRYLYC